MVEKAVMRGVITTISLRSWLGGNRLAFIHFSYLKKKKLPANYNDSEDRVTNRIMSKPHIKHSLLQVNLRSSAKVSVKARLEDRRVLEHNFPRNPAAIGSEASIN